MALYDSTNGSSWTKKTGWGGAVGTECSWFGVTCNTSGNVIKLVLNKNNLSGTIPAKIGLLTGLTQLQLNSNKLTGSIPTEIGQLTNLRALYLQSNRLSGNIPAEIGLLTKLTNLRLNTNKLTGTLPDEMGNLIKLKYLYLQNNSGLEGSIPKALASLKGLRLVITRTSLSN